jgi:NAD(P)-dependent dehydrogenase (short-subunit alcohol dehydrogenase family)
MAPKMALVTGGTAGVGLSVVRALVRSGAFVHFIGTRAEVGAGIERTLNGSGPPVCRFVPLDLSRLVEVEAFARRFAAEVPVLDVLANVAGAVLPTRQETPEGFEKTLAIGYLAPFVLCRALTPVLARAPRARIVNVSGSPGLLLKRRLDPTDFPTRKPYSGVRAALDAVHAKTVMTQTLAERLAGQHIDVNAFHPGAVRSDLGRSAPFPISLLFTFGRPFLSQTSKTADFVATAESLSGTTGQLFVGMRPRPLAFEAEYREGLWAATEALVGV